MILIILFVSILLIAQFFYFIYKTKHQEENVFTVSRDGLQEQSGKIKDILIRMKVSEKDMTSALLLLEEIVMRLNDHTDQVITARVRNFYGKVSLHLESFGQPYNPLEAIQDKDSDSEEEFRDMIFTANSMRLSYHRYSNRNVIVIDATKPKDETKAE